MPLTRNDLPPAFTVHEGENAVSRVKSTQPAGGKFLGAALRARAALGEICSNRSTNVIFKNEAPERDFKKPLLVRPLRKEAKETSEGQPSTNVETKTKPAQEVEARPRSFSSQNLNVDDIDSESNPQLVAVYVKDIYKYLLGLEAATPIKANFMEGYKIRPNMRTILIDWMVEVHSRFKLLQETLYLTVAIMDRFLQTDSSVVRHELQLIGLTSMFIASKFEEMYSPELNDFVYMSDKAYTKKDILACEIRILQALDFNLGRPLPLHFLRRYTKAATHTHDHVDVLHHTLSKYLMELSLPEYDFCHLFPSQLAAASLCLSLKILDEKDAPLDDLWNDTMVFYSGYALDALLPIISKFCSLILKSETSKFQAIRKKYLVSKFYNISALPHFKSPSTLAFIGQMALKK